MKLTRHNGRTGKHGTYNPRHNDRRFDVDNSDHIDAERAKRNIYWDCYRGFTTAESREDTEHRDFTFEEIERIYYTEHYADHVDAQNARNEKTRHTERNRTVEDLLKNNKTCPEESIYQIGTIEESVPPEILFQIVNEFYKEFERRFGSHVHILDWALHLDEGTPHIHERHVFDCENRYGEVCPQQEKALEELGVPLPNPDKPKGRNNNRKQTFDAICRTLLFDITRRHGLHLEQEPSYGGREYLEKQDYILMKQKEQIERQIETIAQQTETLDTQAAAIEQTKQEVKEAKKELAEVSGEVRVKQKISATYGEIDALGSKGITGKYTVSKEELDDLKALAKEGVSSRSRIHELERSVSYYQRQAVDLSSRLSNVKERLKEVTEKYERLAEMTKPYLLALQRFPEKVKAFFETLFPQKERAEEREQPRPTRKQKSRDDGAR